MHVSVICNNFFLAILLQGPSGRPGIPGSKGEPGPPGFAQTIPGAPGNEL